MSEATEIVETTENPEPTTTISTAEIIDLPPPEVVTDDTPPKRKRGRPPGRRPKISSDAGVGAVKTPFAGGPPESAPAATAPIPEISADPEQVAAVCVAALDGGVRAVARMRYGDRRTPDGTLLADTVGARDEARTSMQAAFVVYLRAASVALTPAQALVMAIGAAYLPNALAAEMARAQLDKGST